MFTKSMGDCNEPSTSRPSPKLRTAMAAIHHFVADDRGATAIEYALVASGVAGAIISVVYGLGSQVKTTLYDKIAATLP